VSTAPTFNRQRPALAEFLRLVRVWNLPTAIVDPYTGYLIAAPAGGVSPLRLCAAMLTSALVYSAGMAANDLFDIDRDKVLHPDRPLPGGLISKKTARRFTALLILLGLCGAAWLGHRVLPVCLGLVLLTFTYNGWLKRKGLIGCLNMGACRVLNMWLGIAAAGGAVRRLWPLPATLGIYVTAITLLSLQEEQKLDKKGLYALVSGILLALLPLAGFTAARADQQPSVWLALLPLTLLAAWIFTAAAVAARSLTSAAVGSVVRVAVTGIILLDSAILFFQGKSIEAAICGLVVVPALLLIRYTANRPAAAPTA